MCQDISKHYKVKKYIYTVNELKPEIIILCLSSRVFIWIARRRHKGGQHGVINMNIK